MNLNYMKKEITICMVIAAFGGLVFAENIDPYEDGSQYAWGENVGWFNFEPSQGNGVHVYGDRVEGYVWCENIGWLNLSPSTHGGVNNDGKGNLSGYGWGENVGWINFNPNDGGVSIDEDGDFTGWAWGENIGWINFNSDQLSNKGVKVCIVNYIDLENFAQLWLYDNFSSSADLSGDSDVDFEDYSMFADDWLDYCPDSWQLK
jgi:hypothetical protein